MYNERSGVLCRVLLTKLLKLFQELKFESGTRANTPSILIGSVILTREVLFSIHRVGEENVLYELGRIVIWKFRLCDSAG